MMRLPKAEAQGYRRTNIDLLETAMKVIYDLEVDVLRILLGNAPIEESDEDKPGVILDYDKDGNVVGMEVLDVSRRMENPCAMDYAIATPDQPGPATVMARERAGREYAARPSGKAARPRKRSSR